uniref:Uncharacterized protein n=1 Tax=Euplotes crassus TaxID=5936 RepID=A0A7S3KSP0_EUPCR|mmetsp:Transcript_39658/g.39239  ORF Transcript_39658/g.39239 Transcript_39658/m.39239 type:complete len:105 (+) Transcript_39658:323-637(+)
MKFLMQELELAKVVEEHDTYNKCLVSTPPPASKNKPSFSLPLKGLFSKENPVMPIQNSTPREEVISKPVESRLISLEPLPKINMISVDKFYTQDLDRIIEIDQE